MLSYYSTNTFLKFKKMKKNLLLLVLIANIAVAQDFNNYNFNTQYSDDLYSVLEYETGYLLTGFISDSAIVSSHSPMYGAPVLIKLTKSGRPMDTLIPTSFGYSEMGQTSVYRDGYFYTFGMTNPQNDSVEMVVSKFDTAFNFIEKRIYPQINAFNSLSIMRTDNRTDSTMFLTCDNYNNNIIKSVVFNYNFNTLNIDDLFRIPSEFLITDMLVQDDKYIMVGNTAPYSKILVYDSIFNLLSIDTLFVPGMSSNNPLSSRINMEEYQDSLYLCLGSGSIFFPTHYIDEVVLQKLDSDFQIVDMKSWYCDSLANIGLSGKNALIRNNANEYFLGSVLYTGFNSDRGLFIVKIDSNLNTIWQKYIECTAERMMLQDMLSTNDGGVLILYREQASLIGAQPYNSNLVKIDSLGGITSIFEFETPIIKMPLSLYPNPANDYIDISLEGVTQNIASLHILDINGKEVLQKHLGLPDARIDVSTLASGTYIIEGLSDKGRKFAVKFVKQ